MGSRKISESAIGVVPAGHVSVGTPLNNYRDNGDIPDLRIWVKWVDGTQAAADPHLMACGAYSADYPWTADMIGSGKSFAIDTTQYNGDTLTS